MIKKVQITYPTFGTNGLQLEHEFKKGINIIEADNGYGKSTLLNTIMSAYTFKFQGLKTLPEGTSTIETDKDKFILSKKNWIGTTHESNELYKYCMPGKFFDGLKTTEQRKILIDLLDLDYNKFMQDECDKYKSQFTMLNWNEDLESELKSKLKDSETRSNILVEDIMRLKSSLINFEEKEFKDIDKFYADQKLIEEKVKEYNKGIIDRQTRYNTLLRERDLVNTKIQNISSEATRLSEVNIDIENKLSLLRDEYNKSNENATCNSCGSKLEGKSKQVVLDGIVQSANKAKEQIVYNDNKIVELNETKQGLLKQLDVLNKDIDSFDTNFNVLSYDDIVSNSKRFNIEYTGVSELRLKEYDDYKSLLAGRTQVETELKFKEDQLKSINIIEIQSNLDKFKEIKSSFTKKLEEATKSLPLNIELFETLKNGNIRESFTIKHNGIDYFDLSQGNKMIVNILLSKIFIDKLGMDFILIDEGSSIGKANIEYLKELSDKYQIIVAKRTAWKQSDLK